MATAMMAVAAAAAGIATGAAGDGLVVPTLSGQSLKHLVRHEPVPFREPQPIPLP